MRNIFTIVKELFKCWLLDYRIPVASDLPKIDTVIVEVPNPGHPYGVERVGETSICPPLAAIANAVSNSVGVRMKELPMSPPRILKALEKKMARVYLWAGARRQFDIEQPLSVNGNTIGDVIDNLVLLHPDMKELIKDGVSCAVDDKLIMNSTSEKVSDKSEIYIFQKISGG